MYLKVFLGQNLKDTSLLPGSFWTQKQWCASEDGRCSIPKLEPFEPTQNTPHSILAEGTKS